MSMIRTLFSQAKSSPASSVAVACGGGAAIGGFVSMLGWILDIPRLFDWEGNGITIKFNAALAVTACGVGIALSAGARKRVVAVRILGFIVFLLGLLTLVQYVTGFNLGVDTLFFSEPAGAPATSSPGRMGIPSALSFLILGAALLLISWRKWRRLASALGMGVVLIAWMPISGYIFGAPQLYAFEPFTNIALQTAFFLLFLGIGVAAAVPTHGIAEIFTRPDAGGSLFRLLFIPLVLLSVVLTWLRFASIRAGILDVDSSSAIRSVLELVAVIVLLRWVASIISRAEAARISERRARSELDTHRMVNSAQESERRRIARDLHDSVGQELTALRLLLHSLPDKHGDENLDRVQRQAARLDSELSMLVWQLRPKVLDKYGLVDALDNFSRAWAANNSLEIRYFASMPEERLSSDVETNLYRIVQEALNNIQKHARASEVIISLKQHDSQVILTVQDDGVGIRENEEPIHTTESGGFGLMGMRERAAVIGGEFELDSRPGEGTCVTVRLPLRRTVLPPLSDPVRPIFPR
jgi:signal transduction histidine kinase